MFDNRKDSRKAGEGQFAGKQLSSQEPADKLVSSNYTGQLTIRNLLKNAPVGVDDKLTTIKAAHRVDKDRFQSAFRSLMGGAKS